MIPAIPVLPERRKPINTTRPRPEDNGITKKKAQEMVSSLFSGTTSSAPSVTAKPVDPAPKVPVKAVAPTNPDDLTLAQVKDAVPPHLRASVSQNIVDTINNVSADPLFAENVRNNFISYAKVMQEGKFKIEDYISAVTYVSYKLMNYNNEEAYARTFPQRYAAFVAKGTSKKDISSYVSSFHKGKLVNLIMEQSLVPTWVLNQDLHQKALNVQAEIMNDTTISPKVRVEAANSLLTHLSKPKETGKFQINIGQTENSGMKEMREMIEKLAATQRGEILEGRAKTVDVASSVLVPRYKGEEE